MQIQESLVGKIKNTDNLNNNVDIVLNDIDKTTFFKSIINRLKSVGMEGIEIIDRARMQDAVDEEKLQKFVGKNAYFFLHDEEYVTADLWILSVFKRTIKEEEVFDEENWAVIQARKVNLVKIGYIGLRIFDYAVFGANKDEKDTDVQLNIVSTNNYTNDKWDSYGYHCQCFMIDNEFTFKENYTGWHSPHYKIDAKLTENIINRGVWIYHYGQLFSKFVNEACGGWNGMAVLEEYGEFLKKCKPIHLKKHVDVNESMVKKIKNQGVKTIEDEVDKTILDVSDCTKFMNTLYNASLNNGFERVSNSCYDVNRMVNDDSLCRNMVYLQEPASETCIPRLTFRRFMEMPLDLLNPNKSNGYYIHRIQNIQIRGERINNEIEFQPVFRTPNGYLSSWSQDGSMPIGFRVKLDFDDNVWELDDNGNRKYKTVNSHFSNDFRIVPDSKKGFKIVLGKKSASDKESYWEFNLESYLLIKKCIIAIFSSMGSDGFRKEFLEPLFRYEKGPTYNEYIKSPKIYKNFVDTQGKSRLEYLRDTDPNGFRMFAEVPKIERYLFTELICNFQGDVNESLVGRIKKNTKDDLESQAEELFSICNAKQTFDSILNQIQNDSRFIEMSNNIEIDIRSSYNSAEKVPESEMPPKAKRYAKNRNFYYKVQNFENNNDIPSLYVWKPVLIDGNPMLVKLHLYNSINRDKEIRNQKINFEIDFIGNNVYESIHIKNEGNRLVATETGKNIDYEIDTTIKNNRLIFESIEKICSKVKRITEFYYLLGLYDKMKSQITLNGLSKQYPKLKKQEKIEKQQELDNFADVIRKKYGFKQQIPYLDGKLARTWLNRFL